MRLVRMVLGALVCQSLLVSLGYAAEIEATSAVSSVVLFPSQAEVTRSATVSVPAGTHTIFFTGVPSEINGESLRATGSGPSGMVIRGVELQTVPVKEDPSLGAAALEKRLLELRAELQSFERQRAILEQQWKMLSELKPDTAIPEPGEKFIVPRSAKEITEILSLIVTGQRKVDLEQRGLDEKIRVTKEEITRLEQELGGAQSVGRTLTRVAVDVSTTAPGVVNISTTYLVYGASWTPTYQLQVTNSGSGTAVTLETLGIIEQKTGEHWKDVSVALSTARPLVGLSRPSPPPMRLSVWTPPVMRAKVGARAVQDMELGAAPAPQSDGAAAMLAEGTAEALSDAQVEVAAVSDGPVAVFEVPSKITLESGGQKRKVLLHTTGLEGRIINIAVPSMSTEVYSQADVRLGGAPLLPGIVRVSQNGTFVGSQRIPFTQGGERLQLSIGLAPDLKVTKAPPRMMEAEKGFLKASRKITVEHQVEVVNNRKSKQDIVVLERFPISQNEKIQVSLSRPSEQPLEITDERRINKEEDMYEWHLVLEPQERKMVIFGYTVEFPADVIVHGMPGLSEVPR